MKIPFFSKAAPISRNPGQDPTASILRRFANFARPSATYSEAIKAEEGMQHIVIFRCLDKIATTLQGVSWYVERDPDAPASVRTSQSTIRAIEAVLKQPNDHWNDVQLRYWLALVWAAYGRFPIKVGVRSVGGAPNALYPLDPALTSAEFSKSGELFRYKYGNSPNEEYMTSLNKVETDPTTRYPRKTFAHETVKPTLGGYRRHRLNNTPLNAVGIPSEVITALMQRALDTALGHPNSKYIVATEKTLTDPQRNEVKSQFEERKVGEEESGNVMILGNTKIQVEKLDNSLADIHSKLPLDDMSRQIAGAFGIPVALLGFAGADGSKFANNYTESRSSFFEDTIIPGYCTPIAAGLTEALCPVGYRVVFDFDTIPALQSTRVVRAKDLSSVTFLTDDEKRELCGYSPRTRSQTTVDDDDTGTGQDD